ncbi:MAG TPA: hypothetical protein VLA17_16645 [Candidatus Limnocylindria bacterium]|nr:hypothetical protein [Candidatus Limnocylindria bacterium]
MEVRTGVRYQHGGGRWCCGGDRFDYHTWTGSGNVAGPGLERVRAAAVLLTLTRALCQGVRTPGFR